MWKRAILLLGLVGAGSVACVGATAPEGATESAEGHLTSSKTLSGTPHDLTPIDWGNLPAPTLCSSDLCDQGCDAQGAATGNPQYGLCEASGCVCHSFVGGSSSGGGPGGSRCRGDVDCGFGQSCNLTTGKCDATSSPRPCRDQIDCYPGTICASGGKFGSGQCCSPINDLECPIH